MCCVTPAKNIIVKRSDLRPGLHLNMLGADGPGKAEMDPGAVASCSLFCDEWEQASHGGELTGAVRAGPDRRRRRDRPGLGADRRRARPALAHRDVTLFDSTGLAIQDLAIAAAAFDAAREGRVETQTIRLTESYGRIDFCPRETVMLNSGPLGSTAVDFALIVAIRWNWQLKLCVVALTSAKP